MQSGALNLRIFFRSGNQMVNKSWNLLPRLPLLYIFFVQSCNTGKAAQQTSLGQHEAPRDAIERFDKERDRGAGDRSKLNCKFSSEVYF